MNTKIIFTSALGTLLLLSGCGNSEENISDNPSSEISQESGEVQNTPQQNPEISGKTVPEKKTKLVSKIVDRGFDIAKAVGEIQKTKDIKVCDKLKKTSEISECKDVFYALHLTGEASNENCLKISDENRKNNCTQQFFQGKVLETKDVSFCEKIPTEERQAQCKNRFFSEQAQETKDTAFCEKISDESEKTMCVEQIERAKEQEKAQQKAQEQAAQEEEERRKAEEQAQEDNIISPELENPEIILGE